MLRAINRGREQSKEAGVQAGCGKRKKRRFRSVETKKKI